MPLPLKDLRGQVAVVTMMELRATPGDIVDRVSCGMTVYVTKNNRVVAVIVPPDSADSTIVVREDGSFVGPLSLGGN